MNTPKNSDTIQCKKHGKNPYITFSQNEKELKKVCFLCYVEKATEGLENYK